MLTPLKDYQRDAVKDILKKLGRARDDWHQHDERTSFALSAPTSSGKTGPLKVWLTSGFMPPV